MATRKNDWAQDELKKQQAGNNPGSYYILENPELKAMLDSRLLDEFWPVIRQELESSEYNFAPNEDPIAEKHLESVQSGLALERSLLFLLFDGPAAFYRGDFICGENSWMMRSHFFLGLNKDVKPEVLFELIGNSRMIGYPPSLEVRKDPDHDDHFTINYQCGKGAGGGRPNHDEILKYIRDTIRANVKMHEMTKDGMISEEQLGEFLTVALSVYEAY